MHNYLKLITTQTLLLFSLFLAKWNNIIKTLFYTDKKTWFVYWNTLIFKTWHRDHVKWQCGWWYFYPLILCPDACCSGTWAMLKARVWNSIRISHMSIKRLTTWAISYCLPGYRLIRNWNKNQSQESNPSTLEQDVYIPNSMLTTRQNDYHLKSRLYLPGLFLWEA